MGNKSVSSVLALHLLHATCLEFMTLKEISVLAYTSIFITALLIMSRNGMCLPTDKLMIKAWHVNTMKFYSTLNHEMCR